MCVCVCVCVRVCVRTMDADRRAPSPIIIIQKCD